MINVQAFIAKIVKDSLQTNLEKKFSKAYISFFNLKEFLKLFRIESKSNKKERQ